MSEDQSKRLTENEISEEEVTIAALRAFTFLSTCVEGQVKGDTVSDRSMALGRCSTMPRGSLVW